MTKTQMEIQVKSLVQRAIAVFALKIPFAELQILLLQHHLIQGLKMFNHFFAAWDLS